MCQGAQVEWVSVSISPTDTHTLNIAQQVADLQTERSYKLLNNSCINGGGLVHFSNCPENPTPTQPPFARPRAFAETLNLLM